MMCCNSDSPKVCSKPSCTLWQLTEVLQGPQMQGNAVAFLALAVKGDRSDSETAPERSPPSPTHLWVSDEPSRQQDDVLRLCQMPGTHTCLQVHTGSQPQGKEQDALMGTTGLLAHR